MLEDHEQALTPDSSLDKLTFTVVLLADLALTPIFIGIAVLHSQLWDIDRVINRALVYSVLSMSLGALYAGSVPVLEAFSRLIVGRTSSVAVAVSTLGITAVFGPLRRSIQAGIDRRFNRGKYDAQRMLTWFSERLRDQLDLDQLTGKLEAVVDAALHPEHQTLWVHAPSPNAQHRSVLRIEEQEEQ